MKPLKLAFILFLFIPKNVIWSQINQTDSKGRKQGPWQKTYPKSDVFQYKGQFRDDRPFGTFVYFYPGGEVKAEIEHQADGRRSRAFFYFENKMLMTEGFYLDQKKDSTWVNYNQEGLVLGVETFKQDLLNGKKIIYYLEGQIETEKLNPLSVAFYKNDKLDGEYKEFFSTGKLKIIGNYKEGKRIGEWKEYYPNGTIFTQSKYKDDRLHGWLYSFNKDGEQIGKFMYQFGDKLSQEDLEEYLKMCEKKGLDPNQ
jgi:antitoxin component YwqK of YwqJK toxin-antitoxin module